jgi:hypothetical protein
MDRALFQSRHSVHLLMGISSGIGTARSNKIIHRQDLLLVLLTWGGIVALIAIVVVVI